MRRGVRRPRTSFDRLRACPGPDPGTNESSGIIGSRLSGDAEVSLRGNDELVLIYDRPRPSEMIMPLPWPESTEGVALQQPNGR